MCFFSVHVNTEKALPKLTFFPWCRGRAACIVKLPGPPAKTLTLGKPEWRPGSASAARSAIYVLILRGRQQTIHRLEAPPTRPPHIDLAQIIDGERWLDDDPNALPAAPGIKLVWYPRRRVPDYAVTDSEGRPHPRLPFTPNENAPKKVPPDVNCVIPDGCIFSVFT
jgi:hypothetical protein